MCKGAALKPWLVSTDEIHRAPLGTCDYQEEPEAQLDDYEESRAAAFHFLNPRKHHGAKSPRPELLTSTRPAEIALERTGKPVRAANHLTGSVWEPMRSSNIKHSNTHCSWVADITVCVSSDDDVNVTEIKTSWLSTSNVKFGKCQWGWEAWWSAALQWTSCRRCTVKAEDKIESGCDC